MDFEFPHKAPKDYSYEFENNFKRNITAIWIKDHRSYVYNFGKSVRSIWGFYDTKKKVYLAPVNSKTVGCVVDINSTTPYSAMQVKKSPLEKFFI